MVNTYGQATCGAPPDCGSREIDMGVTETERLGLEATSGDAPRSPARGIDTHGCGSKWSRRIWSTESREFRGFLALIEGRRIHMDRDTYNRAGGVASAVIAVLSVLAGIIPTSTLGPLSHDNLGKLLIGFWVIAPPVFFWVDWVAFLPAQADRDVAKHTHDLARNIWLALVGILAVLFAVKFPGG
jgi:hypothetical protein